MIKGFCRANRAFAKSGRLRRRVRVKSCTLDFSAAGPKPDAADFVRVGLARDLVRPCTFRRGASGKSRHRKIEAAPKKMHRARLSSEARSKLLENAIRGHKNPPERVCGLRIVRCVCAVLVEANRVWHFHRHGPDLDIDFKGMKQSHKVRVEIRYLARVQAQAFVLAAICDDVQLVSDEIEFDFKN